MKYSDFLSKYIGVSTYTESLMLFEIYTDLILKERIKLDFPAEVNLSITNLCNGKCLYCCADSTSTYIKTNDMSKRLLELSNYKPPIIFCISGGEPLLFPDKCLSYFKIFKGKSCLFLLSNLSLNFNESILNVFECMNDSKMSLLQTSIDSLNPKIHNILRKNTDLSLIKSNIDYILKNYSFKLKLNCTVSEYNYNELKDIADYASRKNIQSIHFNTVLPFGRAEKFVNIDTMFKIIDSMIELSYNKNFLKIPEHTLSFPNEILQLSYLEKGLIELNNERNEEDNLNFKSSDFILHIDEHNNSLDVGWGKKKVNKIDANLADMFKLLSEKNVNSEYCENCSQCLLKNKCNPDSFYLDYCLINDLKKKCDYILSCNQKEFENEKHRMQIFSYLNNLEDLSVVTIAMTRRCNGSCNFCQVNGSRINEEQLFSNNELINFLDERKCYVTITGGEPFMHIRKTEDLIMKLKNRGHIVTVLTNLVLADDELIANLKKVFTPLDVIQVSIYSHKPDLHKSISGRDDWDKLTNIIKKFVEKGIEIRANLTITPDNIDYLDETFEYYKSIGIQQICINGLIRKGKAVEMFDLKHSIKYINSLFKFLNKNYNGYSFVIPPEILKLHANISKIFGLEVVNEKLKREEHINEIIIDYNGIIYDSITDERIGTTRNNSITNYKSQVIKRNLNESECRLCCNFDYCNASPYLKEIYATTGNCNSCFCDKQISNKIFNNDYNV